MMENENFLVGVILLIGIVVVIFADNKPPSRTDGKGDK